MFGGASESIEVLAVPNVLRYLDQELVRKVEDASSYRQDCERGRDAVSWRDKASVKRRARNWTLKIAWEKVIHRLSREVCCEEVSGQVRGDIV